MKKTKKLPKDMYIETLVNLDTLFEQLRDFVLEECKTEKDYEEFAEYMYSLGYDGDYSLETAYLKRFGEELTEDFVNKETIEAFQHFMELWENDSCEN